MIINLKTSEILQDGKISNTNLTCKLDTSLFAHLKWEQHFQSILKVDLTTYASKVINQDLTAEGFKANFLGILKIIYCFIDTTDLPTFISFVKLFNLSDTEALTYNLESISEAFSNIKSTVISPKK
jgi:hypothetical protein